MVSTTYDLVNNIQGCKLGYTQSDEITLFITDYDNLETDAWFGYNLQKIVSISASMTTASFNKNLINFYHGDKSNLALFDSRAFNVPTEEVLNVFLDRFNDCTRNSIQSLGQHHFSHKDLQNKSCAKVLEMLKEKDILWEDLEEWEKYGTFIDYNNNEFYEFDKERIKCIIDNVVNHVPKKG